RFGPPLGFVTPRFGRGRAVVGARCGTASATGRRSRETNFGAANGALAIAWEQSFPDPPHTPRPGETIRGPRRPAPRAFRNNALSVGAVSLSLSTDDRTGDERTASEYDMQGWT